MPQYMYLCSVCEKEHLVVKPIAEWNTEEKCPVCHTDMVKQVSTGTRAIFKGPGFYQTDYKDKGK